MVEEPSVESRVEGGRAAQGRVSEGGFDVDRPGVATPAGTCWGRRSRSRHGKMKSVSIPEIYKNTIHLSATPITFTQNSVLGQVPYMGAITRVPGLHVLF